MFAFNIRNEFCGLIKALLLLLLNAYIAGAVTGVWKLLIVIGILFVLSKDRVERKIGKIISLNTVL